MLQLQISNLWGVLNEAVASHRKWQRTWAWPRSTSACRNPWQRHGCQACSPETLPAICASPSTSSPPLAWVASQMPCARTSKTCLASSSSNRPLLPLLLAQTRPPVTHPQAIHHHPLPPVMGAAAAAVTVTVTSCIMGGQLVAGTIARETTWSAGQDTNCPTLSCGVKIAILAYH